VAVARYHLLLAVWDHWLFAGEMAYFLHQMATSALFNGLTRASRPYIGCSRRKRSDYAKSIETKQ
jgi:hypothetical protein